MTTRFSKETPATLEQLANLADATIVGDRQVPISGANPLRDAVAGEITLLDDVSRCEELEASTASAVVVPSAIDGCSLPQVVADDVHAAFMKIVTPFRSTPTDAEGGIHASAIVDPTAEIASDVLIGAGCIIGADVQIAAGTRLISGVTVMTGSRIGRDVTIYPGVVLYENTILEDRVCIHAGSVLGAFGFGYRQVDARHEPTGQLGYVYIESDVEIGASVTIDRGTYGATRIGCGTKIDNLVQIAHNCRIGRHNLVCAQVGIAGSSTTGDYVILAGQVGVKDHIHLGDRVIVGAQAGLMTDCEPGHVYMGSPANTMKEQMQIYAIQRKLPTMRREIKALQKELAKLQPPERKAA